MVAINRKRTRAVFLSGAAPSTREERPQTSRAPPRGIPPFIFPPSSPVTADPLSRMRLRVRMTRRTKDDEKENASSHARIARPRPVGLYCAISACPRALWSCYGSCCLPVARYPTRAVFLHQEKVRSEKSYSARGKCLARRWPNMHNLACNVVSRGRFSPSDQTSAVPRIDGKKIRSAGIPLFSSFLSFFFQIKAN